MVTRNNTICKDFENEAGLYIDKDLSPEGMNFWNSHIISCETCSSRLDTINYAESFAKKELAVELTDSTFEKIINKVFTKRKRLIFSLPIHKNSNRILTASRIRFSLVASLIILAFIFSLDITKQNDVKTFRTNVHVEISTSNKAKLSQMVEMVYGNEFDKQLNLLENQVNELNVK
jgi:hypothetical protein